MIVHTHLQVLLSWCFVASKACYISTDEVPTGTKYFLQISERNRLNAWLIL